MKYIFSAPSKYTLDQSRKRAARLGYGYPDGGPHNLKIAVGVQFDPAPSSMEEHDWSKVLAWLDAQQFRAFSYSPFTGEWRRFFAFESEDDLVVFYLAFEGREAHQ